MSQFIDKALVILKGKNYINKVKEMGLISRDNYQKMLNIINSFISVKNEGYQSDIEEMSMITAVFTETFYHMNTFKVDVLTDIRFYSENLLRILLFLYDDSINELNYFMECSDGLKSIDVDSIYKEMSENITEETKVVMLKGKLFYSLMTTILENNNSIEFI